MRKSFAAPATLFLLLYCTSAAESEICDATADLVVWGGTVCGVSSAVAAVRSDPDLTVLWLVNGTRLGGMTSGGLGHVDCHMTLGGLADELFAPLRQGTEPHVAEAAVEALLATADNAVTVVRNTGWLQSVRTSGTSPRRIVSATTLADGRTYCGDMWIDCSYEGDLMRLSGTDHTFGRESRAEYNESLAGTENSRGPFAGIGRTPMYFEGDVSPWTDATNTTLLPTIAKAIPPPPPADADADDDDDGGGGGSSDTLVQSYNFRLCMTNNASNAIPIRAPAKYDRSALELLRRELLSLARRNVTLTMSNVFNFNAIPNGKIDLNSGEFSAATSPSGHFPFSSDLPFAQFGWPNGTAAERASIFAAHKWWTQAMLFYLGNDAELESMQPGLVAEVRSYGLCADEYLDQPDRWTPQLYVREASRLRGAHVVTQHDVCHVPKDVVDPTAVGLSLWQIDIHAVQRVAAWNATQQAWRVYNIGGIDGFKSPMPDCRSSLVQVPFAALTPRADDTANLLCPATPSFTHVAFSTYRLEPQYSIFGHASGTAAALALRTSRKAVQDVNVTELRQLLRTQNQILEPKPSSPSSSSPASSSSSLLSPQARYTSLRPGQEWLDTDGNVIRAHSGGVLSVTNLPINTTTTTTGDTSFFWFGSNAYPGGNATLNRRINVYEAVGGNLYNWRFRGVAFDMPDRPECAGGTGGRTCYADRCKVLRHPRSGTFVMWCKSKPFVSVSTSASPVGPFHLKGLWAPGGHEVGDCTVFADPAAPDDAYFVLSVHPSTYGISTGETRQVKIFQLTDDWENITVSSERNVTLPFPQPSKYEGKLEAPSPFFDAARKMYHIIASHCTYWFPNDAVLLSSSTLLAKTLWTRGGNPTRNDTSFGSQPTQVLRVGQQFVFLADRFEPYVTENQTGRYVWLPMEIGDDGSVRVVWKDEWTLPEG